MSLDGSYRKCRVTLGPEDLGSARPLRFPAGCRRALPILNATAGWAFENGLIRFLGRDGEPVLAFEPQEAEQEGLVARTSTGEVFLLAFQERPPPIRPASTSMASIQQELEPEPLQEARQLMPPLYARPVPPQTPVDPSKAPPFASVPGIYVVDRYSEHEVCRVSLGAAMLDASGRYEARVLDGCHDTGLHIFDPVAWRYEAGRLTLQARKGHQVTLISERDGQWRRDPDVGATLLLRKAAP
jgi:protease inhibitor Inh